MGTEKRERQKAGRQARLAEAEASAHKARTRQRFMVYGGLAAVVIAVIVGISLLTSDDDDAAVTDTTTVPAADDGSATTAAPTDGAAEPVAITVPPPGATLTGETPCPAEDGSAERTTTFEQPPPTCIDPEATYTAEVSTSVGSFTIALDAGAAPETVNNFVVLSRYHSYDGVAFHRIIPGFVVQGGDAVGPSPGVGGPGYEFADELPTEGPPFYQLGSVAMANSGPDTNGSQFFVVTGDSGVQLPAQYSLFGQVTDGMDVVMAIEAAGSADGTPTEEIVIESISVTQA